MKKVLILCLVVLLVGCGVTTQTIKNPKGTSKTYQTFKNYNSNKYYIEFYDRNNTKNDSTKIIVARNNNKYYYEIKGNSNLIIIQKDNYKYTISPDNQTYSKEKSIVEDYSIGILPSNINVLKTKSYETGEEKVFGSNYIYEKYKTSDGITTYYYKGSKLTYVRYKNSQKEILFKYNLMKNKVDNKLFNKEKSYEEITY